MMMFMTLYILSNTLFTILDTDYITAPYRGNMFRLSRLTRLWNVFHQKQTKL